MIFQSTELGRKVCRLHGWRLGYPCPIDNCRTQVLREILYIDGVAHDHHARVSERVLQFPHVTGPGMLREQDLRAVRETTDLFTVLRAKLGDKMSLEKRNVVFALG